MTSFCLIRPGELQPAIKTTVKKDKFFHDELS